MSKTIASKPLSTFLIVGLVCGIVLVSGCSQNSQPTQTAQASQRMQTVKISVSWVRGYQDLKSLKQASDIVVAGTITKIARVTKDKKGIVTTDFVFSISHIVWDPRHLLKDSSIIIHQTGGIINNIRYEVDDDPLFQLGERAVLFLHEYKSGYAYVVGGPTGRFTVQGGMVTPINDEGVKFTALISETAFFASIQNA